MKQRWLILSDMQWPFEAKNSLEFCLYVQKHFKIPIENILCVGDEVDELHGGMYPKDPDGHHTANSEITACQQRFEEWGKYFPYMRLAISNHGMRWAKKAAAAEIPSQMLRTYQEVMHAPPGWKWADSWRIDAKHPFMMFHGMHLGGKTPYRQSAEIASISTVFGHLHSSAGVCWVNTHEKSVWSMNCGSLIDVEAYAFKYGKDAKFKPCLGVGVVLDDGLWPIFVPYSK